jgi:hypothetical protein
MRKGKVVPHNLHVTIILLERLTLFCQKTNRYQNNQALLKEWVPLAHDKTKWQHYIDSYFESCRNISQEEEDKDEDDTDEGKFYYQALKTRENLKKTEKEALGPVPLNANQPRALLASTYRNTRTLCTKPELFLVLSYLPASRWS